MVKNPPASAGDVGSIPGSGRSPGKGNDNPFKFSCLRNSMDRGAWRATGHGFAKRRTMTERLTLYSPIAMLPIPASLSPLVTNSLFSLWVCFKALFCTLQLIAAALPKACQRVSKFPYYFLLPNPSIHCGISFCFASFSPSLLNSQLFSFNHYIDKSAYCKGYKTQVWALPPPKTKIPRPSHDVYFCFLPQWKQVGGHFQRLGNF